MSHIRSRFRPAAGPADWVAAIGVLSFITLTLAWLSVAFGLAAKSVEGCRWGPQLPAAQSCAAMMAGYLWAKKQYNRDPVRS